MITFKQFIAEIDYDDEVYSKEASAFTMNFKIDGSWQPLIKINGAQALWKRVGDEFRVAVLDKETDVPAFRLELLTKKAKVPGGTLIGVVTQSLSSREENRGKGAALKIYKALVEHGQVLFSSNSQTTGSRALWERLVQSDVGEAFVLAEGAAARWYSNKFKIHEGKPYVLLTGSFDALEEEAYASSETRWVIVPHELVGELKAQAIELIEL